MDGRSDPPALWPERAGTNQAGDIILSAKNLIIAEGAQIANGAIKNFQLENAGGGGEIQIAADHLTLSGMAPVP
jgi:hypothetical protein